MHTQRRIDVIYEGRVQGVGFRFTVVHVAGEREVTGFVRNCPDGSVQLVAEGTQGELQALLAGVRASPVGRYITAESPSWSEATREFDGFRVVY